jgi:hypothetical protein
MTYHFARANWDRLSKYLDHVIQFIPAESGSYDMTVIAADKRHIPRGYRNQYIPGCNHQCDKLYERFNSDHEKDSALRLLEKLNVQIKSR